MPDNEVERYSNKLLINKGINSTDFHWRINSADARSSNGAGVPLTFVSGGRSGRRSSLFLVHRPDRDVDTRRLDHGLSVQYADVKYYKIIYTLHSFKIMNLRKIQ